MITAGIWVIAFTLWRIWSELDDINNKMNKL